MRRGAIMLLSAFAPALHLPLAQANEFDTLNVSISTSLTYDSNLFRLADSVDPRTALGTSTKSDLISTSSLALKLDKSFSQQQFQLDISETVYRYRTFSFLDFEALEYRGSWLWHFTPRISGTLGADRREALVPFGDIRTAQQNLRVTDREYLTLEGQITGGWYALLGASHFQQKDSRIALSPEQSYDAVSSEAGIKYLRAPGTSLALIQRYVNGSYKGTFDPTALFDSGFHDNQTEVVGDWNATGKSSFHGRLTWIDRNHDNFSQRDYSAWAGEASNVWSATGKSRFNFALRRDVTTWWEQTASYRVSDTATAAWTWQMMPHTALLAQIDRVHRDYRGPVGTLVGPLRVDNERSAQLGLNWTPRRSLLFKAGIQRYTRSSNYPVNDFETNIANVSAAVTF